MAGEADLWSSTSRGACAQEREVFQRAAALNARRTHAVSSEPPGPPPSSEETPDENDVAAETGDEQAAEPKGTYFRHGRGKYIEGEYSYDGEWEHVRNTSRTRIARHERPSHNTIS